MDPTERPPGIVRWILRLEETAALDRPVEALDRRSEGVFGTRTRAVLRGEWLGRAGTRCSPTSRSAPRPPPACSTWAEGGAHPPLPRADWRRLLAAGPTA